LIQNRSTYADLHPSKALGTKVLGDGPDPVMATSPPLTHDLDSTSAQIDIIMQYKNVLQWYLEVLDKAPDAITGTVHVGLRFNTEDLAAIGTALTKQSLHFQGVSPPAIDTGKMIDKEKSDIMPC